uniref:G-protein coupled receptors family 1 profile domain-containing protein n=1 Tax=Megaselia scalaris TaxID=36166 RepID=T1GNI6_MEGSC
MYDKYTNKYIFVCHAPMARTWCTMQRVKRCTFCILVAAFLHQVPRILDQKYNIIQIPWENSTAEVCHVETSSWVFDFGVDIYYMIFFMFRIFFVHLIPCALLVTLNLLLFRAMKKAQDRRKKLLHDRNKDCSKTRDANCTTLMLIVVVTVFLIVEIPIAVITSLHVMSSMGYLSFLAIQSTLRYTVECPGSSGLHLKSFSSRIQVQLVKNTPWSMVLEPVPMKQYYSMFGSQQFLFVVLTSNFGTQIHDLDAMMALDGDA